MKLEEEEVVVTGIPLRRIIFRPDRPEQIRSSAILIHGHGDYSARYEETMEVVTRHGLACVATDLPGHGKSPGKRGVIPGFAVVDEAIRAGEERCRQLCPEGPFGLMGHSAGGLIGLRAILRDPDRFAFAWISSPLVAPEDHQNPFLLKILPLLARLVPNLTASTLITPEQCWRDEKIEKFGQEVFDDPHTFHTRIGIRWGHELVLAAREVRAAFVARPPTLPLLLTQGLSDQVCPPRFLRRLLDEAELPRLRYVEFPVCCTSPSLISGGPRCSRSWMTG